MSDAWVKEAERRGDEADEYNSWIESNEENILESYRNDIDEFPNELYEGLVKDDYEDAEEQYIENLKIKDVPNDYISERYNLAMEGEN